MEKAIENLNEQAEKLKHIAGSTDLAISEMRIQFETLAEMQKEERLVTQEMHNKEMESVRKHYGRIIMGLILTIVLIIGSLVGAAIYLFTNFEFTFGSYQELHSGSNGSSTIYDGIHYDLE